ncbi:hypothetical protein CHS0354_020257 [Potamilus streckersoni]|uniref:Uncharacterized protein n=1 Tax=Potamilus streckersoni TaxID=2493646 RepID=A0AAE0VQP8_9BIVA|nr:hypothetical protein CHS0354_020257 [Potamilus streckersoni]
MNNQDTEAFQVIIAILISVELGEWKSGNVLNAAKLEDKHLQIHKVKLSKQKKGQVGGGRLSPAPTHPPTEIVRERRASLTCDNGKKTTHPCLTHTTHTIPPLIECQGGL